MDATLAPLITSTVPPLDGPDHGATPVTSTETNSYRTPADVNSAPFVLTSSATPPADAAVELHTSSDSLADAPRTLTTPNRHCNQPDDAEDHVDSPLPTTVTGVPPSATPADGDT